MTTGRGVTGDYADIIQRKKWGGSNDTDATALNGKTINVKAGATLDINHLINRMPNARIVVEDGGKKINDKFPAFMLMIK